jgi:glutaredoxin
MRKFLIIFSIILFSFLGIFSISDASEPVNAYLFTAEGCPHCAKEQIFLKSIQEKYSNLEIKSFEISKNAQNVLYIQEVAKALGVSAGSVPFLIIGDQPFIGFSEKLSPSVIEAKIKECSENICPDSVAKIVGLGIEVKKEIKSIIPLEEQISEKNIEVNQTEEIILETESENKMALPILGEIDIKNFSLPILTIVLAFLDGFNPCAMWVLLFLVSLLFGMKNKKKLWIFGLVFLFTSAFVYFLFMTAWLNLFMFLGFIFWVRLAIGSVALASGYFNLKEFITNPSSGCKVTGSKKRQRIFESLKKIIQEKHIILALLGLILLAFAVNLVELVCSLGLPTVYTQILALSDLTKLQYYLYLVFYVFIFILPAFIVFAISAFTLQLTGISTKYTRLCHLIGGIIMTILGLLMIFKPEWLMFG